MHPTSSQAMTRPTKTSAPLSRRSDDTLAEAGTMPPSAVMLTWWALDHQRAGSRPTQQDGAGRRRLRRGGAAILEEGVEGRLRPHLAGEGQLGGLQRAAPLGGEDGADHDAVRPDRLTDAPRLGAARLIEVALGGAVAEPHAGRVAEAWGLGMADQQDAAGPQRVPGVGGTRASGVEQRGEGQGGAAGERAGHDRLELRAMAQGSRQGALPAPARRPRH